MTLIKFGGGIVGASGSMAGNTFSRNRFGAYIRARTVPVNPQSARQVVARARVGLLAEEWSASLTPAERLAWAAYAASISWTNALGETVKLTAFNHFIRSNAVKLACGAAIIETGPTVLSLPNQDPTMVATLSVANGITITFDDTLDWAGEDDAYMVIEAGMPQLHSRTFFNGPWRITSFVEGNTAVPITSPQGPFAEDTWTLILGQVLWMRFRILRADGRVTKHFGSTPVTVGA